MSAFPDFGSSNFQNEETSWRKVYEFSLRPIPGYDQRAGEKIASFLSSYRLRPNRLFKLKEAVRVAAGKMINEAPLVPHGQMIEFQVLASEAVVAFRHNSTLEKAECDPVGWGFFLVQILDGPQTGLVSGKRNHLLRLYVYIEGEPVE
jgi:hypothetical protein